MTQQDTSPTPGTTKKPLVLLIDDDKIVHRAIARELGSDFELCSAFNGEEGVRRLSFTKPDTILLDIEMPGKNGYEICEELRRKEEFKLIPIVFLSGHSSLRERMLALESGANDYLVKPCTRVALLTKLSAEKKSAGEKQRLSHARREAEQTAKIAMAGSSELGVAMRFAEQSYLTSDYQELAEKLVVTLACFDLNASVTILGYESVYYHGFHGEVSPLEQQLISMLRKKGRIFDFGCRSHFNFDNCSILVKNMPLDDPERYGRIKDLVPAILGAANTKIKMLNMDAAVLEQSRQLGQSFEVVRQTLLTLGRSLHANHERGTQVMNEMMDILVRDLPGMGLEEDQEQYILKVVDNAIVESTTLMDNGSRIAGSFDEVLHNLETLVNRQNALVHEIFTKAPTVEEHVEEASDEGINAVELF